MKKITEMARMTAGQRENALWAAVRKLRFTASNFGQIIGAAKRNRLTPSLKKRLLSAYNLEKRAPIQWGITYEARALEADCKIGGVSVMQTGIWLHESGILGASPDGFVNGKFTMSCARVHLQTVSPPLQCFPDIVEVKCPFSAREMTVHEACTSLKDFYLVSNGDGHLSLKVHMIIGTRFKASFSSQEVSVAI